jgi:hypothetical protein
MAPELAPNDVSYKTLSRFIKCRTNFTVAAHEYCLSQPYFKEAKLSLPVFFAQIKGWE